MGYRKDIKRGRKLLEKLTAELAAAQRAEEWGRVSYLANEIYSLAYDLGNYADSAAIKG